MDLAAVDAPSANLTDAAGRTPLARAARALRWFFVVQLAWSFPVGIGFRLLAPALRTTTLDTFARLSSGAGLLFDVVSVALVAGLAVAVRGRPGAGLTHAASWLVAAGLVLAVISTALVYTSLDLGAGPSAIVFWLDLLVSLAAKACLWLGVARLLGDRVPRITTGAFVAALVAYAALALPTTVLAAETVYAFVERYGELTSWLRFALSMSAAGGLLWLFGVLTHARARVDAPTSSLVATEVPTAGHHVVVGAVWLAGGIAVSVLSFALAAETGGGHYVVTTGAIAYGVARIVRGLRAR